MRLATESFAGNNVGMSDIKKEQKETPKTYEEFAEQEGYMKSRDKGKGKKGNSDREDGGKGKGKGKKGKNSESAEVQ